MNVHNSVVHNSQEVEITQYPSTKEWISKTWYIHAMEYYLPIKRNEELIRVTTDNP